MEATEKIKQLDAIATQSDPSQGLDGLLMVYIFNTIVEHLRGREILEMGCRGGRMTGLLASVCEHLDVVDGSRVYLERAKENVWANNVDYHWSLFEEFNSNRHYTDIVMVGGLDHVDGPVAFLRRYADMLAPGGAMHIIELNALSMHRRLGVKMNILKSHGELTDRDRWLGHLRVYGPSTLRRDIEAAGFVVTYFTGIFLKPLATGQLTGLGQPVLDALFELGKDIPEWCNYIYYRAEKLMYDPGH
ncbi:MAG: class I SAM-dependent methyltransferase [bacterium]|jgi:SAM-dependent methyltransferase